MTRTIPGLEKKVDVSSKTAPDDTNQRVEDGTLVVKVGSPGKTVTGLYRY